LVSGRIEKAKWLGLSLPTWKGHTALWEESLPSRTVLEKSASTNFQDQIAPFELGRQMQSLNGTNQKTGCHIADVSQQRDRIPIVMQVTRGCDVEHGASSRGKA